MIALRMRIALWAVLAGPLAGCSSLKSTMLTRDETNMGWQTVKSCGVPITLSVPTHLRVQIQERRFLTPDVDTHKWIPLFDDQKRAVIALDVKLDFIRTEKIFTVDFKRPAAGTIDFSADFQNQYITKLSSSITDRTIADVSLALQGILSVVPKGGTKTTLTGGAPAARTIEVAPVREINSVRAVGIFEIDDPMWELNVAQFIEMHLCPGTVAQASPTSPPVLECFPGASDSVLKSDPLDIPAPPDTPAPRDGQGPAVVPAPAVRAAPAGGGREPNPVPSLGARRSTSQSLQMPKTGVQPAKLISVEAR